LKFGAGAGRGRSVAPIVCEIEVTQSVEEEKNVVQTTKSERLAGLITFLRRSCLLKHTAAAKVERIKVTGRRGRRCKQLLDKLKEKRGYWKLK
jgi:hypothetical protein